MTFIFGNLVGAPTLRQIAARTPARSVLHGLWWPTVELIGGLFYGYTDQHQENEAENDFLGAVTANELGFFITHFKGAWSELDDELDAKPISLIALRLSKLCDQRDYLPWRMVAGGYAASFQPPARSAISFVTERTSLTRWHDMVNDLALRQVTAQEIGALPGLEAEDRIATGEIQKLRAKATAKDRALLDGVLATCEYTDRLVRNLAIPDVQAVLDVLTDISHETNANRLSAAITVMVKMRDTTLAAMLTAVRQFGQGTDEAGLLRIHTILEQADQISNPLPGGITSAIVNALQQLAQRIADVQQDIDAVSHNIQDAIQALSNFSVLGGNADNIAQVVISDLRSNNTLWALPTFVKISMIRALLDTDATGDDDEQAILSVLGDPHNGARTPAEFFAMYGGVGHEDLEGNIDGQENDDMYAMLRKFTVPREERPH